MKDEENRDDEVVEPDDVIDPDDRDDPDGGVGRPRAARRGMSVRTPPDKWSRWSMYAGLASLALLVLFPMLIVVVMLAGAAVWFGVKANRALDEAEEPDQARKRARAGIIAGGLTLVGILALVVYFNFFYEVPEKIVEFNQAS